MRINRRKFGQLLAAFFAAPALPVKTESAAPVVHRELIEIPVRSSLASECVLVTFTKGGKEITRTVGPGGDFEFSTLGEAFDYMDSTDNPV